jgi:hypothetical protein
MPAKAGIPGFRIGSAHRECARPALSKAGASDPRLRGDDEEERGNGGRYCFSDHTTPPVAQSLFLMS